VLGTVGGAYLGLGRFDPGGENLSALSGPFADQPPAADPAAHLAEEKLAVVAQAKAEKAAAEEAERARRAEEIAEREREAASRS
jgi:hypothetical protein